MACCADLRRVLVAALFATAASAAAANASSHDVAVERAATEAIAERWGVAPGLVHITWIDRVPASAEGSVSLRGTGAQGHWLVDVLDADGRLHRGRVRAGVVTQVAVAAHDLPRGALITAADVAASETIIWGPPAREVRASVEGWTTRRVVTAGETLTPPAVAPPLWVRAGEDVRVIVVRGSLELTLPATAAGAGTAGDRITVRTQTGKRLTGSITAPGVVRVDAGKDH